MVFTFFLNLTGLLYFPNLAEFRDTAPLIFCTSFDTPSFWKSFVQFYTVIKFLTRFLYCKKFYKIIYIIGNLIKMQLFNFWSGFFFVRGNTLYISFMSRLPPPNKGIYQCLCYCVKFYWTFKPFSTKRAFIKMCFSAFHARREL